MNSSDIVCIAKGHELLSKFFRGVFSPDTLPERVQAYPSAYVCNTDPSHLPGSHWIVMWIDGFRTAEFFDSFGRLPEHYDIRIKIFLNHNSKKINCNEIPIQKKNALTCGYHVLFYLMMKCQNYTMNDIVHILKMQDDPDVFVYQTISQQTECI